MAVRKMNLISIVGPCSGFDDIVEKYVANNNIQLEDALLMVDGIDGVKAYSEQNPYHHIYRQAQEACAFVGIEPQYLDIAQCPDILDSCNGLDGIEKEYDILKTKCMSLTKDLEDNSFLISQLKHMENIDVRFEDMFNFEFMRFRFGKFTKDSYDKLNSYLGDLEAFFFKGVTEGDHVYGIYVTPHFSRAKVDSVFASLNFERIRISPKATGEPNDAIKRLEVENISLSKELAEAEGKLNDFVESKRDILNTIFSVAKLRFQVFNVRQLSVKTDNSFYISGWMPEDDAIKLHKELEGKAEVLFVKEKPDEVPEVVPPTALKNPAMFKPFESLMTMYAYPSYKELDPTVIFGLTYIIMFGMMFGDLGQGAVLAIMGFLLYRLKKIDLGAVLGMAGLSSMVFGYLYGSVFGNEHILHAAWIQPMENSTTINTILLTTTGIGVLLIIMAIGLSLFNAIRTKSYGRLFFSQNGLAGLTLYVGGLGLAYLALSGSNATLVSVALGLLIIPLLLIYLQEPLSHLVEKKKDWMPKNKGEFLVEAFFELFDILLSFVTNTISFVRVGAFALIHVGMMMVVYIFADMTQGVGSIITLIIGNIFIMALEGLIVGIQVLRLEFYEIFSRFFRGDGRPFSPLYINDKS